MKSKPITLLVILLLIFVLSYSETDEFNTEYCHDPVELKRWQGIIENHKYNDDVQGLHALWIGLCMKVEMRQLTVNRADEIFENERT